MGENFWKKHAERRMKISRNKYMKVKEFLEKSSLNIVEEQLAKKFVRKAKDAFNFSGSLADRRKRNYIMTEEKTGSLVAINRLSEDEPVYRKKSKVVPMKSAEEQVKSLIEHYDAYDKDEQLQRKDALTAAAKEILAGEVGGEGPLIAKTYESDSDEYEKNKSRRGGSFLHSTSRKPSMFASFFGQSTKVKRDTITSTFSRDGNDEAKQQGNEGADNKLEKEEATGDFLTETLSSASQPLRRKSYDSTGEQTPTESKNNSVLSPTSQRRKSIAAKTNNDQQDEIVGLVPSRKGRKSSASSKREGSSLVDNDHPLARKIADVDSTLAALSNKPSVKNAAPNSAALPPIRSNAHNRPLSANPSSKTNSVDASGKQRVSVIVSTSVTKPIIYVTK